MASRVILTLSAAILFMTGGAALFAPEEVAIFLGSSSKIRQPVALIVQIAGSALLGFAVANWMSRANRMGGIYGRPLGVGNALLFTSAALSLGKAAAAGDLPLSIGALCGVFALLALGFLWLVFGSDPLAGSDTVRR